MIGAAGGVAAVVVTLTAIPGWLAPGLEPPAAAWQPTGTVETVREVEFGDCTFKLVNNYSPEDGRQYVRTRQVWSEDCRFGSHNRTIRVRACFEDSDGSPVDCSDWLMPISEQGYAESVVTGPAPRDSIHYAEIREEVRRFDLAAPEPPPAPPPPAPLPPPPPAPPPAPAPTPTAPATDEPEPAVTGPAGPPDDVDEAGASSQPELWEAASQQRPDTARYGLAAGLAAGGLMLLGLGGTGIWLLRRSGSGAR